jgi:hypothetical protein
MQSLGGIAIVEPVIDVGMIGRAFQSHWGFLHVQTFADARCSGLR